MILLIDNYDSFVYNLARYFACLGFEYRVVRNDAISIKAIAALKPSHIVISPGPCTPTEAGISLDVVRHFYDKMPILGVCLGHQAIAQAFGGRIMRATKPMHGKASLIWHTAEDLFKNLANPIEVGRYHSLIVSAENFPSELKILARSATEEIMALRHKSYPVFGVQFHPESVLTVSGMQMLAHFLA